MNDRATHLDTHAQRQILAETLEFVGHVSRQPKRHGLGFAAYGNRPSDALIDRARALLPRLEAALKGD